jgi:hypothetical protein
MLPAATGLQRAFARQAHQHASLILALMRTPVMTRRLLAIRRALLACVAVLVLAEHELDAQNWPQWRGPSSLGVSSGSGLPTTWSETENLAWKAALAGFGTSSPIVCL